VIEPRGTLSTRRVTAHWVVLAAAALTTLVAAACGGALAVFAGQALPLAARHELSAAPSTAISIAGPTTNGRTGTTASALRNEVGRALRGIPFQFWPGTWSGQLDFVPGSLPARPASAGKRDTPLLEAAALGGITSHAILVSGHWPAGLTGGQASGSPGSSDIPAALPTSAAALLHVSPGDVLTLKDAISGARIRFRITGVFAPGRQSGTAASYWGLDTIPASGSSTYGGYITYGPLVVSPAAFAQAASGSGSATATKLTARTGTWLAQPDTAKFTDTELSAIAGGVSALRETLARSSVLGGIQLSSSLPSVLSGTASNLSVARSLLVIMALQLIVLALAALLAVARLLAGQREDETALITARGATRWQLVGLTAAEVIPLCAVAAAAGALAGIRLAGLLASSGPLRGAAVKLPGPAFLLSDAGTGSQAGTWLDAIAAALVIMVIAVIAMLGPVLGSGPATTEARVRRGRQATIVGATRAGADIALVVLAVLAGWQLRRYSADSGPSTTIDPVLVLAPALALAGGTVVTLRLLPAAARAGDRFAARGRHLTASLAGWQVSRLPLRQGGAALLLVMAVATGTLAFSQHASWIRSAHDQGSFAAGADARVDTPYSLTAGATGRITNAPGVEHAMAVYVQPQALPVEVLAINAAEARSIVRIRPDQVSGPTARLFDAITPKSQPGTAIAGRPVAITLTAALTPTGTAVPTTGGLIPLSPGQASAFARQLRPVAVTVTVADSTGDMYQLEMGTLPADGRKHVLAASLGGARVDYPLRLVQVALTYQMPRAQDAALALTVTGPTLGGWKASATSPAMQNLESSDGTTGLSALPARDSWAAGQGTATFNFSSGFGQALAYGGPPQSVFAQVTLNAAAGNSAAPLPAIATSAFADANDLGPGSVFQATINGLQMPLSIAAVVKSFPTVTATTGALIIDLPAAQERVVSQGAPPLAVTEWWLSTTSRQIPPGLPAALPPGSAITGAAEATAALIANPLSAAPQQALLALAAAAALLAITGFWVSIAANVRQRRAETALLAALGISKRSAALQLCLEKLMLSVPSALLGLVLGTAVASLLVPAVTLTAVATQPVPPPLTLFDLPQTLPLAAAVAIVPALATALIMIRRPDPAAELRAAEAA
jgi:ABC-type antimicrobial peptide transport system permease subunit